MKRYIKAWNVGEPSSIEYADMIQQANRRSALEGFRVTRYNVGGLGCYVDTPNGGSYKVPQYNGQYYFDHKDFKTIRDVQQYMLDNNL